MSVLTLASVANQMLQTELPAADGILCVDIVNYFESGTGDKIRFNQLLARATDASHRLSPMVEMLMKEFCDDQGIPFRDGFNLDSADQLWHADGSGKYQKYTANITFAGKPNADSPK